VYNIIKRTTYHLYAVILAMLANSALAFTDTKHFGKELCNQSGYRCAKVHAGDTWAGLFPNSRERDLVMRLNRTNVALKHRPWIVIPVNLSRLHVMDISPFPEYVEPRHERMIVVNLAKQAFAAYNAHGNLVTWGPISGGQKYCADLGRSCTSKKGTFRLTRKKGAGCVSSKYPLGRGGSKMPYCMFYHKGFALHGSTLPGHHASHGCIRLFNEDAEWLNKGFINTGPDGTIVVVQAGMS
jgi:L,D-transpeptidase ErfK/SrfK